jgi:hypothetical protein
MAAESAVARRRLALVVSLAAALGIDAESNVATATIWPVGRCSDIAGKGGDTLRQAIGHAANNDIVDLSTVPASCTGFTLTGGEIPINVGTLSIVSPRNITINANANGRIFNHTPAGGILYLRYLTLTNGSVASGKGGCARTYGKLTLSHTTITGCQANGDGGGAYAASCNVVYSTIDNNLSLTEGSGLFCNGGVAAFVHSSVTGNLSRGGVFAPGSVAAYYSTFANNSRDNGSGGAIKTFGQVKLVNSTVSGNQASGAGGGIDTFGNVTAQHSVIAGNSSGLDGGGIYAHASAYLTDTIVDGNDAGSSGGGVFASGVTLTRSTLSANSAADSGGGAYAESAATMTNSTISGNHAVSGGGLQACCTIKAYNSTVVFNVAAGDTAGAAGGLRAGKMTVASSIVAKNSASGSAGGADVYVSDPDVFLPTNSLIVSCNRPTISIKTDPILTPLGLHGGSVPTHALSATSPAVDAGSAGGLATDERGAGYSRAVGASAVIGAFERQANEDELTYSGFE